MSTSATSHRAGDVFPPRARTILRRSLAVVAATLAAGLVTLLAVLLLPQAVRAAQPAAPFAEAPPPAGLFFKAGRDDALLEAPTLKSDVAVELNGQVARVKVRQRFHNPSDAWLEGVYVFPLPERSAVDRLVMTVGQRRIEGRILEKEAAEKVYREAAAQGRRASLLSSERPNVFVTSLANVGPGEEVVIEIEYQDQVAYDGGRFSYRFPMVVAPRYTPAPESAPLGKAPPGPAVPPARAQPIALRPSAAETAPTVGPRGRDLFGPVRRPEEGLANPVSLRVSLDAGLPLEQIASLYHPVSIEERAAGRWLITLADGSVPADRDFLLEWRPAVGAEPQATVFAEEIDGDSYLLVSLLPPQADEYEAGESEVGEDEQGAQPRDLIFVIDTSGSMHGRSIEQARQAVTLALDRLATGDRFNVIRFDSTTRSLFPGARPANRENLRRAKAYVRSLEAEGGTEMLPALARALDEAPLSGRLRQVVFLTDGAVGNEHDLFLTIAARLGEARLFTVGIGAAPNSYFMRKAAELGRGGFTYIGDPREVGERMSGLFRKLERPALTDLTVGWPEAVQSAVAFHPATLPDLYADQPVGFAARIEGVTLDRLEGALRLSARRGEAIWQRNVRLAAVTAVPGVAAIWARAKFADIQDGLHRGRDRAAVRKDAVAVALKHRLVTTYTSLVAVDEARSRPEGEPLDRTEVPRNLPHGMDYDKVFGAAEKTMPLRSLPAPFMREAAARGAGVGLPQTATPAEVLALSGLGFLLLGLVFLIAVGRIRQVGI
ncbi:MAG: marine proteobacterial sortase target protein [Rhodospirillales bacterium]|nr:marine proteobacterial sortase target protein [Rhodospirillales bacterium]